MSLLIGTLLLLVWIFGSGVFSGSETGVYTVSRVRVQLEARAGRSRLGWVRWLLRDDAAVLITLLIGTNLMNQLATYQAEALALALGAPEIAIELIVALCLTPLLFFFGEVFPKDLFRRRPLALLSVVALPIRIFHYLVWPLGRLLWAITALPQLFGREPRALDELRGRAAVVRLLEEGAVTGAIEPHAELLAHNVLKLRTTQVSECMTPWKAVETLTDTADDATLFDAVRGSVHTRLPVVGAAGDVRGYVHQLDVLRRGLGAPVLGELRQAVSVPPGAPVDRALARLRASGQRMAVVGSLSEPLGLLTLKDLVEEISGELAGW